MWRAKVANSNVLVVADVQEVSRFRRSHIIPSRISRWLSGDERTEKWEEGSQWSMQQFAAMYLSLQDHINGLSSQSSTFTVVLHCLMNLIFISLLISICYSTRGH